MIRAWNQIIALYDPISSRLADSCRCALLNECQNAFENIEFRKNSEFYGLLLKSSRDTYHQIGKNYLTKKQRFFISFSSSRQDFALIPLRLFYI